MGRINASRHGQATMLSFIVQVGVLAMLVLVNATKELVICFGITEKLDHGCPPVQCN